ncbi:MAG TPA: hypothetical protein VFN89_05650 [Solirubrobacterales bacterium]|nr:hypothetical protein [Solirubrobacterales bacterium]
MLLIVVLGAAAAGSGCGGGASPSGEAGSSSHKAASLRRESRSPKNTNEYTEVLTQMRAAAADGKSYDGYGFAEYMPSPRRAAIDAFCAIAAEVADEKRAAGNGLRQAIARTAAVDLKRERGIVAPMPTRRAIATLTAIVEPEALDPASAGRYVHVCYR